MHKEHKACEEVEVDWAGDTMSYVVPGTGEIKKSYLFVAVLQASSYPLFMHMEIITYLEEIDSNAN
jgi:transposase